MGMLLLGCGEFLHPKTKGHNEKIEAVGGFICHSCGHNVAVAG
jgi:hypothetical protein